MDKALSHEVISRGEMDAENIRNLLAICTEMKQNLLFNLLTFLIYVK